MNVNIVVLRPFQIKPLSLPFIHRSTLTAPLDQYNQTKHYVTSPCHLCAYRYSANVNKSTNLSFKYEANFSIDYFVYPLVPNRRGVGISGRGWKNLKNIISGWGGIAGGGGGGWKWCNNLATSSFSFLLKRRLRNLNVLCYVANEMYDMKCIWYEVNKKEKLNYNSSEK